MDVFLTGWEREAAMLAEHANIANGTNSHALHERFVALSVASLLAPRIMIDVS